jgi:hypothetical protein
MEAMQNGRSFPTARLRPMVEEKLSQEMSNIWRELFANPELDIDTCLHAHLDPLAQRMNLTLGI